MKKIKVGIIGAAGYTGGELIRVLVNHPHVEIIFAHSKSNAHKFIYKVHTDLTGEIDLQFSDEINDDIDVLFLCVGHGESAKFLRETPIRNTIKIIDLSQDFRLQKQGGESGNFVYGLPELNRDQIRTANKIANPGCFATSIQLALLPLAKNDLLKNDVHISATTGSTGAGQSLSATSHFSWRQNNLSSYKVFRHQHLDEIEQSIIQLQPGFDKEINFIPYRGSFTRGILSGIYTSCEIDLTEVKKIYNAYYADHPFIYISDDPIDLKQVVNTNKCLISIEKHEDKIFITSCLDNLLKGASGQAVQNMNLCFGLDETAGLKLKANYF